MGLMLPTSIEFFVAFFGILYAGAIPVPIYPPMRLSQLEDHLRRQTGILRNAGACMLITMPEGRRLAGLLGTLVDSLHGVASVAEIEARSQPTHPPAAEGCRCDRSDPIHFRAAPAIRKASCSATQICSQISARWAESWMRAQPTSSSAGFRSITIWV